MTPAELVERWKAVGLAVPAGLVEETLRHGETVVPHLGALIADPALWKSENWAGPHATMLLAAIKSPAAAPFVAAFLRHGLGGDFLQLHGELLVRSVGTSPEIWKVLEDPDADVWGRVVASDGLTMLALEDPGVRGEVIERLRALAARLLEESADDYDDDAADLLTCLLYNLATLHDEPARDLIRRAEKVDPGRFADMDLAAEYRTSFATHAKRHSHDPMQHFAPENLERLAKPEETFEDDYETWDEDREALGVEDPEIDQLAEAPFLSAVGPGDDLPPEPVRLEPKTGRNDPCPCASGKKYKKCCGK